MTALLQVEDCPGQRRPWRRDGSRHLVRPCTPARSSASPAWTGTGSPSSWKSCPDCDGRRPAPSTSRDATSPEPGCKRDPRPRRRPHPGGSPATRSRPRLLACREPRAARLRQAAELPLRLALPDPVSSRARRAAPALRRPRRRPADPRRRRSPGATSRRSCWPGRSAGSRASSWPRSRREGSTSGRSSSSTGSSSRRETRGSGVLLVSLELEEILSLSDRVLVIYEGRSSPSTDRTSREEELGIAMTGGTVQGEAAA